MFLLVYAMAAMAAESKATEQLLFGVNAGVMYILYIYTVYMLTHTYTHIVSNHENAQLPLPVQ